MQWTKGNWVWSLQLDKWYNIQQISEFQKNIISFTLNCNLTSGEMDRLLDVLESPRKVAQQMSSNFDWKFLQVS